MACSLALGRDADGEIEAESLPQVLPFAGMTRIRFDGSRDHPPLSRFARPPEEAWTIGSKGRERKAPNALFPAESPAVNRGRKKNCRKVARFPAGLRIAPRILGSLL
jgi:hypothetical protein